MQERSTLLERRALQGVCLRRLPLVVPILALASGFVGCDSIPQHVAPKAIVADGVSYTACEGFIWVYSPSRGIVDSTAKSYEIEFTDDYGKAQDLKEIKSFTIREDPDAHYAMAMVANPDNKSTTYSNGTPITKGNVVLFGNNGDGGRAIWNGAGDWASVPCKGPLQ
jgi:hypothetical protein